MSIVQLSRFFLLFFSSDSFYILSKAFLFVKNFFNFFQSYLVVFQQQAYLYYHKLFRLSRIFSILFLCRFSRISLNSLSFSFSLVKNFFILFRHFSVVFQLVKIPFLNSVLNKRRRRDLNPRAATNDLLPFQGSPFNHLGTSALVDSHLVFTRLIFNSAPGTHLSGSAVQLAERVGFEPTRPCGQTVFKTASL